MRTGIKPHPEWKILVQATSGRKWGELISYDEIISLTGITRESKHWNSMISRWKREMLKEYKRCLVAVPKKGYRILTYDEVGPRAKHVAGLGVKKMGKGVKIAENAPFSEMGHELRQSTVNLGVRLGMLAQMCREKLRDMPALPEGKQETRTPRSLPK